MKAPMMQGMRGGGDEGSGELGILGSRGEKEQRGAPGIEVGKERNRN